MAHQNVSKMDHFFDTFSTSFREKVGIYPFSALFGISELSGPRVRSPSGTQCRILVGKVGKSLFLVTQNVVSQEGPKTQKVVVVQNPYPIPEA